MKLTITFDITPLKQVLLAYRARVPGATKGGMEEGLKEFRDDCLNKPPRVPYESGFLADHHEILPVKIVGSEIVGTLRVPGPYAASIHEGISRHGTPYQYKTPGTGAKWVQSKLLRYGTHYIAVVVKGTKRRM